MTRYNSKSVPPLSDLASLFLVRYTHHVMRKLDPPKSDVLSLLEVGSPLLCNFPNKEEKQRGPAEFRADFATLREYFSNNLVRSLHEFLAETCAKYVTENRLLIGDLLLQLVFQDHYSKVFVIKAKHIVYRRWTLREERTLHRTLALSSCLVKIALPGIAIRQCLQCVGDSAPRAA